MDLITYALVKQEIGKQGVSDAQISTIKTNENNELIIILTDGREFKIQIPTTSPGALTVLTETVNQIENEVNNLGLALENQSNSLTILEEKAITTINIGDLKINSTNNEINLPLASGTIVGVVMAKIPEDPINSVNSISINNKTGYLEVASLNVDKLYQDEGETLILDCSQF